jgi:hypothetical protein
VVNPAHAIVSARPVARLRKLPVVPHDELELSEWQAGCVVGAGLLAVVAVLVVVLVPLLENRGTVLYFQNRDYPQRVLCGHFPPASGLVRLHGVTGLEDGQRAVAQPWIFTVPVVIFVVAQNGKCVSAYELNGGP